ncbi:MAG: DUF3198 domain-containing protein [Candidatus Hodarchaeales archaeon]|jgi:amino acid transporter
MSLKRFLTTYTLQFGLVLFIIGIILTIIGIYGVFIYEEPKADPITGELPPEEFDDRMVDTIGDWIYWCILIGPVLLIAGGWYFFDNINKRREFKELIATTSKAKFIRNQDNIEFLAWKLTQKHQNQLADKKKEFHIKK